ncbi:T9SS type A sorting domain-containing protein [Algibacter sp. R77976]|uniref:T9SS type A sorting domain-containing protein n=1 Tax=Algibacter sp. R77976 TaxID=3093873 RepID=UPI0037C89893
MKTKYFFSIAYFLVFMASAQSIDKFSIDSGGELTNAGGIQMLYTIGEVNVQELSSSDVYLSEGFINGDLLRSALGINEAEVSALKIKIYPNPASEVIHINSDIPLTKIEIYDVLGKQVFKSSYLNKINVENYNSGIYILKMYSVDNQFVSKRVVIH